jgi:hypothetical protein
VAQAQPYDYSEYEDDALLGDNAIAQVKGLVTQQLDLELIIAQKEEEVTALKADLRKVSCVDIPALMDELDIPGLTLPDGTVLSIVEEVRASLKKGNETEAFEYIESSGNGQLIKRQFVIEFSMGEEKWAAKFMRDLSQRKKQLDCAIKRTVASSSLTKFVKGELASGNKIPLKPFGVFRQRKAKIKVTT